MTATDAFWFFSFIQLSWLLKLHVIITRLDKCLSPQPLTSPTTHSKTRPQREEELCQGQTSGPTLKASIGVGKIIANRITNRALWVSCKYTIDSQLATTLTTSYHARRKHMRLNGDRTHIKPYLYLYKSRPHPRPLRRAIRWHAKPAHPSICTHTPPL